MLLPNKRAIQKRAIHVGSAGKRLVMFTSKLECYKSQLVRYLLLQVHPDTIGHGEQAHSGTKSSKQLDKGQDGLEILSLLST